MNELECIEKTWKRLEESLYDKKGVNGLCRLANNAETLCAFMESNNILAEASKSLYSLQSSNKKINLSTHDRTIDNALVFIFLKSLSVLPMKTKAFRLGLIDKSGRLIRKPVTDEENDCISNLDLLMFKIRQWLAPRIQYLNNISWIKSVMPNVRLQNYFSNQQTVARQFAVRKINDELDKILKK